MTVTGSSPGPLCGSRGATRTPSRSPQHQNPPYRRSNDEQTVGGRHRRRGLPRLSRGRRDEAAEGHAEADRVGGLHPAPVGQALRTEVGLRREGEIRRLVGRDGDPDETGRRPVRHGLGVRRRILAPDLRQGRSAGRRLEGRRLQELQQGVPKPAEQHDRRQALRRVAAVGAEHAALQHEEGQARTDLLVGDLQREVQGQGHRPGQPDPDRRRGAVPDEDEAVAAHQGPVRAEPAADGRGGLAAEEAEAADQEVLGARIGRDRPVQERRRVGRRVVALPDEHARRRQGAGQGHRAEGGRNRLARHVDAVGEVEERGLRVQVALLDLDAEGAGAAGDRLRRDAGEQARVQGDGQDLQGVVPPVPRGRAARLLQADPFLEDADRRLRQRKARLPGLHEVATGLDVDQGLTPSRSGARRPKWQHRLGGGLWRRPWLKAVALLGPAGAGFAAIYIAALVALLLSALWTIDPFTGVVVHTWTLDNFRELRDNAAYRNVALRTVGIAAAVTITDALVAFPFAYFMARLAGPRVRAALFVLVLLPLWASYLARVYAWRLILSSDGLLNWTLHKLGLPSAHIAYTNTAMWIVFSYIWLPFMILPIYAALERIPHSYIEASRDLGAKGARTFRSVILPLALPGVIAGSIFTFSLTLGDYITPVLVGGASSQFIGNVVYDTANQSSNLPFAAAYATVPLAIMGVYLLVARRLGAFEAL